MYSKGKLLLVSLKTSIRSNQWCADKNGQKEKTAWEQKEKEEKINRKGGKREQKGKEEVKERP